jgi:DNA-binding MarR family transcriptional regulator
VSTDNTTREDEPGTALPPGLARRLSPGARDVLIEVWRRDDAGEPFPTVRELCAALGVRSTSTVHAHLSRLERDGLVQLHRGWGRARSSAQRERYAGA